MRKEPQSLADTGKHTHTHTHTHTPYTAAAAYVATYNSPSTATALLSATLMRKKMATAQSHNLREMTKTGTSGSFSRVRCNCRSSEDMLRKLATETTRTEAAVSRFMAAWFWVTW